MRRAHYGLWLVSIWLLPSSSAYAQGSGVADAVLALPRDTRDNVSTINGRIYGGSIIDTTITHGDGNPDTFTDADTIAFTIGSTRGTPRSVVCPGNRTAFEACIRRNADDLVAILFPGGMSESVSGRDSAQYLSQQFLLTTALGMGTTPEFGSVRRSQVGGFVEHEWYSSDAGDGRAWQGLYQVRRVPITVQGRYAHQDDLLRTRATTVSVDFHPSVEVYPDLALRVGGLARTGLMYSRSDSLDLGSIDVGGGAWVAGHKDYARMRIGAGTLFQVSNTHVPESLVGDDADFLARAINDRGVDYDITYGGLAGYLLADRTSVNVKALETRPMNSDGARPVTRLVLAGVSYLIGGHTPVDFGYKISTGGGFTAHSIFAQGNFTF